MGSSTIANNVAVWARFSRNAYFPQPAPDGLCTGDAAQVEHIGLLRDYYARTWGDERYRGFKRTLEESQATYKFVFAHHTLGTGRGGIELPEHQDGEVAYRYTIAAPARRP
jgi:hypothetical protein